MASVNKWIGIGNLTKDSEVRYMANGEAVTNITIACNDSYKDKTTGEKKEVVEFVRIVFFRKLAEIAGQYLKKGAQVYIEGSLKTRKWQDKEGKDRYTTEIVADTMKMLGSRQGGADAPAPERSDGAAPPAPANPVGGGFNDFEDDIPF